MFGWYQERKEISRRLGRRAIFSLSFVCIANLTNADDHSVSPIWASHYEIDLSTFDLDADADGDGLTGREEAAFGTDPLDGVSVLRPTLRRSEEEYYLEWDTIPGALYQIEFSPSLGEWEAFGNPNPGTGTQLSVAIEVQGPKRFFRVSGLTPPDGDHDGLNSLEEHFLGTDPDNPDSDGDTFYDGEEAAAGANPGDAKKTPVGAIPPEPASIAPPADPSTTTNAFLASQFLYTGDNPIQTGVAESAIEGRRAAIMRGKVSDRKGTPLPGVKITILNCPEFGRTLSRSDGMFDLVVNGGGTITVRYERNGFLPVQRSLPTGWLQFSHAPDVALTRLDTAVTPVDLTAAVGPQLALGSEVSDGEGTRRGVLLVNEGTQAEVILPDGSTQAVDNLNVRITEYTVGESGPNAMPGLLPPASAYTYAFELSADESVAKVAGKDVLLSQPVYYYVDNFLGFPVGINAPVGYYDNDRATWVPSENGRVIAVVGEAGGLAELDVDGDDIADTGTALTELGIDDAERNKLAGLYDVGDSLWRVALDHFSTWDVNWGVEPDAEKTPPSQSAASGDNQEPDSCGADFASFIIYQDQAMGEAVPVVGTEFQLVYTSSHSTGWRPKYQINIPLTRDELPDDLVRVDLEIFIAGFKVARSFDPAPNLSHTFEWGRFDVYGNFLNGSQPVDIRIGYVYESPYAAVGRFGFFPDSSVSVLGVPSRGELSLQQNYTVTVGGWDEMGKGLGGWTFDIHHAYDPTSRVLHMGDGSVRVAGNLADAVIKTVAGGGFQYPPELDANATDVIFSRPVGVAADASGGFYVADEGQHRVFYFNSDGSLTSIIGTGVRGFSGDGGAASEAQLSAPRALAVGVDGGLYIVEQGRVRRVDPDGIIDTIAGTGVLESDGDGGLATEAKIWPLDVAEGPDGNIYIADLAGYKIRRVDPEGIITTIAGTGVLGFSGDGGPAAEAQLKIPVGVDVGADGSIFVAEFARVRQISSDGLIRTIAGNGTQGSTGDGFSALGALIDPIGLAVAPDGGVYIFEACRIRRVRADGVITAIAGSDLCGLGGDGGPAVSGNLHNVSSIDVGPDGSVFAADTTNHRIRRIEPAYPGFAPGDNPLLAAEDGSVVYRFTDAGRHLQTINALTGGVLYEFSYDSVGRLTGITDGDGNETVVERDTLGNATAIVGPFGQKTELALDDNGFLSRITNPADESMVFAYTEDGLMTSGTDANENTSTYEYCALGRLIRAEDAADGFQTLERAAIENGYEVTKTDALGRKTTYRKVELPGFGKQLLNTFPDGTQTETVIRTDGEVITTYPDGTIVTRRTGPDPRFGMQAPVLEYLETSLPDAGIVQTITGNRQVTYGTSGNPLNLASHLTTYQLNGNRYTLFYDGNANKLTTTTPENRTIVSTLDDLGRQVRLQGFYLAPSAYSYSSTGQLEQIEFESEISERITSASYNTDGFVETIIDPLAQPRVFDYTKAGRLASMTRPDSQTMSFQYDAQGRVEEVIPPGRSSHLFTYTNVDLLETYVPPDIGPENLAAEYLYNSNRQVTQFNRRDGRTISMAYSPVNGKLTTITSPRGKLTYKYDAVTGQLARIATTEGAYLDYVWMNGLMTKATWSGLVNGKVNLSYDANLRISSVSINESDTIQRGYDRDGLLNTLGDLSISLHPLNGMVSETQMKEVSSSSTYNEFGELESLNFGYIDTDLLETHYTERDALGRIGQIIETIQGETTTFDYTYDSIGRLKSVSKNGTESVSYTYDDNGNRTHKTTPSGTISATYDAQDRLVTYGQTSYSYSAGGDLMTVTSGSETTSLDYDVFGNLRSADLPNGNRIEYLIDGRNRRIGKEVNGVPVHQFLYLNQLQPVAELDSSGEVVARFVYGTRINVPDYMIKDGTSYQIISDHLGSVRLVVDVDTGIIAQRLDYDEFGKVTLDTDPGFQPFGYAGGIYDTDTGLIRFGARDYDPETGRWTAEDPLGFRGGQSNLWVYADGDPLNRIDPLGLSLDDEKTYFYGGLNFGGGGGSPFYDDDYPNYFGGTVGLAVSESLWDGRPIGGIGAFAQGTAGKVVGGYVGAGFKFGMMQGDSLSGETNSAGILTPLGSFELVWDPCTNTWVGFEIGLGPSIGAGLIGSWSDTAAAFLGPG